MLFDEGVQKRNMSLAKFADIIATAPAKRFGLTDKGSIALGKDADFVFIKQNETYTLQAEDLAYRNKMSPYIGREIGAQVTRIILRGQEIYSKENGISDNKIGRFI